MATETRSPYHRPPRVLFHAEPPRALLELWQFSSAYPLLAAGRGGDGHTVLTLPGFGAGDGSTRPLRVLLAARGYRPEPWTFGRNLGPTNRVLDGMSEMLARLYFQSGRRSASSGGVSAACTPAVWHTATPKWSAAW